MRKCSEKVRKRADFNESKSYKDQLKQDSISRLNLPFEQELDLVVATFTKEDFVSEFSKMRVLLLMDSSSKTQKPVKSKEPTEEETKRAFKLAINGKSEIIFQTTTYRDTDVKESIKQYFAKYKEKSIVILSASRSAEYGEFKKVQDAIIDAILEVRKEYSLKTHNKDYYDLSDVEKEKIKKLYSLDVRVKDF